MALMSWGSQFSVKIDSIDAQHKELLRMLNEMFEAMQQGKGKDVMGKILSELIAYTATHFAHEEKFFDQHGYPDSAKHKAVHKDLVAKVLAFQKEFNAGNATISTDLMKFLKDWLITHIMGSDKLYSDYLVSKGVK